MITAKEWLAQNDPTYVKPAEKAAATRKVAFTPEAIEAMSGSAMRKVNGRYVQCSPLAFVGSEGNGEITPYSTPGKIASVWVDKPVRTRGKRGGRKHRN